MRTRAQWLWCLVLLPLVGCAPGVAKLNASRQALEEKQTEQAIAQADEFLKQTPHGPGSAEALYLRGRAYETRVASSSAEASANLQSARESYIAALKQNPPSGVEAYIRTSLANVAYFQNDYTTAIEQWGLAYPNLREADLKAWLLYRVAVSQQRLGRFNDADRTLAAVQQEYPGSAPAGRAAERQGVRGFYVQTGVFANASGADATAAEIRRQGLPPVRLKDSEGRHIVRAGPFSTYAQATAAKAKLSGKFGDALIVP